MKPDNALLRQIHPSFVRAGMATSQAFRPTPKDEDRLSCDDGSRISPERAWSRYTEVLRLQSDGVQSILVDECQKLGLTVDPDGTPYQEHVSVVFPSSMSKGGIEKVSKILRDHAARRGWMFRP